MYKKILLPLLSFFFVLHAQNSYAICASKIIYVQDTSLSVNYRINEANMIKRTLDDAVGANNYIYLPMDDLFARTEGVINPTTYGSSIPGAGVARSRGYGHTLPYLSLASAVKLCDHGCDDPDKADQYGRSYKCAIIYWGDNVITHKNPNIAAHDYRAFKWAMSDTSNRAINSSHRFFINLSFVSTTSAVSSELRAMSEELYLMHKKHLIEVFPCATHPPQHSVRPEFKKLLQLCLTALGIVNNA